MKQFYTQLFIFFCCHSFSQINLTSGLSACYSLDGNVNDPVNALNGTITGVTATANRFNTAGSAMLFNGSTASYVQLPNNPLLKPTGTITISGWFKPAVIGHKTLIFTRNNFSSNFAAYGLTMENTGGGTKFSIAHQTGSSTYFCVGTTVLTANTWYHIVASVSTNSLAIYVNGVLENSVPVSFTFNYSPSKDVVLGGTNETIFNNPYSGAMDNLRFYTRWLNPAEVTALYQQDPSCVPSGVLPPVASFAANGATVCAGETVAFTDLSTNNPTAWDWQVTGAATGSMSSQHPTFFFSTPGTYTVALISSNIGGPSNTATQTILVHPVPALSVLPSANPSCPGDVVTLNASGASSYSWSTQQLGQTISVSPLVNTTYTVTGINTEMCVATLVHVQNVLSAPPVSITGPLSVCAGQFVQLTASGALSYTWANFQTGNTVTLTPQTTVTVSVSGSGGLACAGHASHVLNVHALPTITTSVSVSPVCVNQQVNLTASGAQSYSWSNGMKTNVISIVPAGPASYTVTGTNELGCSNSAIIHLTVSLCTGLENTETYGIRAFPNPSNGLISISMPENIYVFAVLRNLSGEIIVEKHCSGKLMLDITEYEAGLYLLDLSSAEFRVLTKIIKM